MGRMGKEIASSNLTAGVYQPGTNQAAMRLEGNQSALAVPGARLAFFPHSSRPADRALIKRSRATSDDLVAHRSSRRAPSPRDGLDLSLAKSCEKNFNWLHPSPPAERIAKSRSMPHRFSSPWGSASIFDSRALLPARIIADRSRFPEKRSGFNAARASARSSRQKMRPCCWS